MRKRNLLLFIFSLLVTAISFGQIAKGSILLGGDLSASTTKQENLGVVYKNRVFTISPLAGIAIKDNLFLGGYFNIGLSKNTTSNIPDDSKSHSYGLGIFLRKYTVIKNNFFGFLQENLGWSYNRQESSGINSSNVIQRSLLASLSPGLSYKISKKLHLEAGLRELISLAYINQENNTTNSGTEYHSKSNSVSISTSLNNFSSSFYFGFRLLINKKTG